MAQPINTADQNNQSDTPADTSTDTDADTSTDDDANLWRRGPGDFVPMSEMSDNDIRLAYYKAVQKIGEHGDKIVRHQASIQTFFQKAGELEEEADGRGISMSAVTRRQALEDALEMSEVEA